MFFATSAMSCYVRKPIKMVPTSIRKQLSNQHPNLDRFWSQLDSILGGFWGPRWGQDGTKSLQKSIQKSIEKMITFWIASRSIFDRFWAPTWPPRGVTFVYKFDHLRFLGPTWGHLGAKMAPRPTQEPPGDDVLRFGIDFRTICYSFFNDLLSKCGCFLLFF